MPISNIKQPAEFSGASDKWKTIDCLHSLLQERTNLYVEQLSKKKNYLEHYVAVLTAMLDSIGDGVIVCDADGNLALINEAAAKLVGDDLPPKVGEPWPNSKHGLFYADNVTAIKDEDRPLKIALTGVTAETVFFGLTSHLPDGGWFRVHATPVIDKDGTLHGAIVIFHDITEIRNASRQREALSALITHDLKNHLIGESRLMQMLIAGKFGPINDKQKEVLTLVEQESVRQFQAANSLVEIFRYDLRSEALVFADTDISQLVRDCVDELAHSLQESGLEVSAKCALGLPRLAVDKDSLRHVLKNLLGNAIKFTAKDGFVKVDVAQVDGFIKIAVSDHGPGIPEDEVSKLFTSVWPEATSHHVPESSGLGLYLCAKIMDAHGGRIVCESEVGKGTTFSLFLPLPGVTAVA